MGTGPVETITFGDGIEVPSPNYLRSCEEAEPGSALRVLDAWRAERQQQRDAEWATLRRTLRNAWLRLAAGFVLALGSLIAGCWLVLVGQSAFGVVLACVGVAVNTMLMVSCLNAVPAAALSHIRTAAAKQSRARGARTPAAKCTLAAETTQPANQ